MLFKRLQFALFVLVLSVLCSFSVNAQAVEPYATVKGTVSDQQGKLLAGVTVTIKPQYYFYGTHDVTTVTDKNGNYLLTNILRYTYSSGGTQTFVPYNIFISFSGFQDYKSEDLSFTDDFNLILLKNILINNYNSQYLTTQAWAALARKDLNSVLAYTNQCISLYSGTASNMQAILSAYPTGKANIFSYWALNDVAASYYIQGLAYQRAQMKDEEMMAYLTLVNDYFYGQIWDPKGFFWKPSVTALNALGLESYKSYYSVALKAILNYQNETDLTRLPVRQALAVKAVTSLNKFNQIQVYPNGPGLYDYALGLLTQAVQVKLANGNNVYTLTQNSIPFNTHSSFFGQNLKVDQQGDIFVYASSISTLTPGTVYEFLNGGGVETISPVAALDLKFAVRGNILVAADNSSRSVVNVFTQQNNAWAQVNSLDITSISQQVFSGMSSSNFPNITDVVLSDKALVVTLADGHYLVFNNYSGVLPQNPFALSYWGQLGTAQLSADADGSYVVIGSGSTASTVVILQAKSTNISNTQWKWQEVYRKADTANGGGFGLFVGVYQATVPNTVTVAIGSASKVYLLVKPNAQAAWPALKVLPAFMNSSGSFVGEYKLAIGSNTLIVPYTYIKSKNSGGPTFYFSGVMVYALDSHNNWTWAYSLDGPSFFTRSPLNVDTQNKIVVFASTVAPQQQDTGAVSVVSPK